MASNCWQREQVNSRWLSCSAAQWAFSHRAITKSSASTALRACADQGCCEGAVSLAIGHPAIAGNCLVERVCQVQDGVPFGAVLAALAVLLACQHVLDVAMVRIGPRYLGFSGQPRPRGR